MTQNIQVVEKLLGCHYNDYNNEWENIIAIALWLFLFCATVVGGGGLNLRLGGYSPESLPRSAATVSATRDRLPCITNCLSRRLTVSPIQPPASPLAVRSDKPNMYTPLIWLHSKWAIWRLDRRGGHQLVKQSVIHGSLSLMVLSLSTNSPIKGLFWVVR